MLQKFDYNRCAVEHPLPSTRWTVRGRLISEKASAFQLPLQLMYVFFAASTVMLRTTSTSVVLVCAGTSGGCSGVT